jgi:hypothetical protein
VLGSATVCTAVRGGDVRPILALNLAGELGDTAAGLLEWRDRGRADALVVGSLAPSAAGIAMWIAALRIASRQS